MKKFNDLDSRPYTGKYDCHDNPIKVRVVSLELNPWLKKFFDGTENVEQITSITPGKEYAVVAYEVFGDVADVAVIDDIGEEQWYISGFFEEY